MKKYLSIIIVCVLLFAVTACGTETSNENTEFSTAVNNSNQVKTTEKQNSNSESNILVVYFSRTGNTKELALKMADYLNADTFEIEAADPYTDEDIAYYTDCRADREQKDLTARPKIANKIADIDRYDTIVLGYPIWHSMAPKIIYTFLESYDLSDKTIAPFCTSASSGIGNSDTALHNLTTKDVTWKSGKRFAAGTSENELTQWLNEIGIQNK